MKKPSPRAHHASLTSTLPLIAALPRLVGALPVKLLMREAEASTESSGAPLPPQQYWSYIFFSAVLVLTGGIFAGLTLALMGQDEVYLKVISTSGDASEQRNAKKVLQLIDRGKHWVLVTLLLSNVITNETLPIVLDRVLGGGWPAVVSSTASIVIFGEVIPQSVCVRYGLQIGAFFTPFVLGLMYIMFPIAYPIALLLDSILGEDHGTMYKKSGLKTLVTLHRTMGVERLNNDEVTIISAVLDLKEKSVAEIMTPLKNVYTMASDRILDERCVEEIFNSGFSRIPIHQPGEPTNFTGMLLVRVLISYDPEDALPVSSFPLATLPETPPDTSCLNILNYFQEGKSHMVVVSETPGEAEGALGVLTLEDVIEELIGEEIVDESDVFIDVDRAIRRMEPGPLSKRNLTHLLHHLYASGSARNSLEQETGTNVASFDRTRIDGTGLSDLHFKPQNLASNPLATNKSFVTIKRQPQPQRHMSEMTYDYEPDEDEQLSSERNPFLVNGEIAAEVKTVSSLPMPKSISPKYGSTNEAELSAKRQNMTHFKKFHVPSLSTDRNSTDLTEDIDIDPDLLAHIQHSDSFDRQSHRAGGIIERSVVNDDGVEKVIIQSRPDDEEEDETVGFLVNGSRRGSRLN